MKESINKFDFVSAVAGRVKDLGLKHETVKAVYDATVAELISTLEQGKSYTILGLGRIYVTELPERQGVNPATGERITIPASKKVQFSTAPSLRKKLNGK